ncbi:MAG: type II toxin-antitoxin system prevent-host-death family antitoxin [Victivallales bacterium]|nr:type II toxin-antitoxin system prevent-host-death family antitoxin [Victivallales bacterium]
MHTVSVREVQHHLAEYLKKVEKGEELRITRRSRPVAVVSPLSEADINSDVDWSSHRQSIMKIFGGRRVSGKRMETIVAEGRERL